MWRGWHIPPKIKTILNPYSRLNFQLRIINITSWFKALRCNEAYKTIAAMKFNAEQRQSHESHRYEIAALTKKNLTTLSLNVRDKLIFSFRTVTSVRAWNLLGINFKDASLQVFNILRLSCVCISSQPILQAPLVPFKCLHNGWMGPLWKTYLMCSSVFYFYISLLKCSFHHFTSAFYDCAD